MSKLKIFLISLVLIAIGNAVSKNMHFESVRMSAFFAILYGAFMWAIISFSNTSVTKKEKSVSKVENEKNILNEDDSSLYLNAMNEMKESRNEALWAKCYVEKVGEV